MHLQRATENLLLGLATTQIALTLTHTTTTTTTAKQQQQQQQLGVERTHAGVGEKTHLDKHYTTHPLSLQSFQETSSVPLEKTSERDDGDLATSFESNRSHEGQPARAAAPPYEYHRAEEESCVSPPPITIEPGSRSKPGKVPVLASAQTLARRLALLLTARNPLWTLSFRFLHALFAALFRFLYAAVAAQFRVLTLLMLWFWDEILFPMTFPIRLVIWATVILPISLTTAILRKLKPVILFALSAVTMGILIGSLASSTHEAIGDWLFPLHHHHHHRHPASKKKPSQKKKDMSLHAEPEPAPPRDKSRYKKRALLRAPTGDDCQAPERSGFNTTQSSQDQDLLPIHGALENEAHAGSSCDDDDDDDGVGGGEEEELWEGCARETEMTAALGPAQTRYTSAIEPSHARAARHRHHHQRPNASSAQANRAADPNPPSPDAPSILKLTHLPPSASSPSPSPSDSRPRSRSPHQSSLPLHAPRKKKVTFKTD
ncbi:hypothetical protein PCANC_04129 [Puccinia coronata f. sp. avenae]|uniref:Uncharacterized protein n=1 Tax=Puccinia coronata f. sp. avenae TaxID=200324 RepID=A0A2N5W7D4_9BASI|nr:hypothetical protein PCANC_20161 [Puccinia coronata f. sp. avenae]PLW58146.1 hypothetical protein PCANC_04129 [Puccinia coronata f. sp. avenae]